MRLLVLPPPMPRSLLDFSLRLLMITALLRLWLAAFKLAAALGADDLCVAIDAATRIAVDAVVPINNRLLDFRDACFLSLGAVTFVALGVALQFAVIDMMLLQLAYVLILAALLILSGVDAALNFYCCFTRTLTPMCRTSLDLTGCHRSYSQEGLLTTLLFQGSVRSRLPICFLLYL